MERSNGLSTPSKKRKKAKFNSNLVGFLMGGLPTVIAFCWLGAFPKIMGFILPFTKVQGTNLDTLTFVGLNNFKYLFTNPNSYFWKSFSVSCKYLFSVPIGMAIALFVATQLNKNIKGAKGFRVIMFLPTFVSGVAMSIFWRYVFQTDTGILNSFFKFFGAGSIDFLNTERLYMPSVIFTTTWGACANSVLFQASLANVDQSIKESAKIDGASEFKTFWKITFPAISPTTFYQLIMSLIGALQVFTSLQLLSNGTIGPNGAALSLVYYVYEMAFEWSGEGSGLGMATACAMIFEWFIILLTVIVFATSKKWVHYD